MRRHVSGWKEIGQRSVVIPLVVANVIIFLIQMTAGEWFTNMFQLTGGEAFTRPYMLITHMFLHGGPGHLFWNMYALMIFGPLLEQKIGPKRFILLFLGSGFLAGFISSFVYPSALGASGAIMGMLGTLIILMPNLKLLLFFFIPMPLKYAGILWALLDIFGLFYVSGIGNVAHLVGLAMGLLYGLYLKAQRKQYTKQIKRAKSHMDDKDINEWIRHGRI